jgi:hypothetical protein
VAAALASPTGRRRSLAAVLLLALGLAGPALAPPARAARPATYANPVSRGFADTFADPSVIRARDGGALRWPTQPGDLVGTDETASVLLRHPPAGTFTVETRLAIDLGTDDVRNYQQAGLPAGTRPRIGLVSHGGAGAVAEFDYLRIYQP